MATGAEGMAGIALCNDMKNICGSIRTARDDLRFFMMSPLSGQSGSGGYGQ